MKSIGNVVGVRCYYATGNKLSSPRHSTFRFTGPQEEHNRFLGVDLYVALSEEANCYRNTLLSVLKF